MTTDIKTEDVVLDDDENIVDKVLTAQRKNEAEKLRILAAVASNAPKRVADRVAWILNHYPEARDSDVKCQLLYWRTFQPELYNGGDIGLSAYPDLQRLNSISRSRATVQNVLGLFVASPEVRRFRGKLSEEEKQKALEVRPTHPVYCVYADESGKTSNYVLVGSVWVLKSYETFRITNALNAHKKEIGFGGELHFKEISKGNFEKYRSLLGVIVEYSSKLSFKALAVERRGLANIDDTINKLHYHMLISGVKEEDTTGRAILPRNIQFRKDAEEASKDELAMMEIRLQLENAASSIFNGRLYVDVVEVEDSSLSPLMQLADLFTGSISRVLNVEGNGEGPKDIFAREFLSAFGMRPSERTLEGMSQCISYSKK